MVVVHTDWMSTRTGLFWRSVDKGIMSLLRVQIDRIVWQDPSRALLQLRGHLPYHAEFLNLFSDGDDLYLRHTECGRLDDWNNGDLIMQFLNCKIRRKWIKAPCVWSGDKTIEFRMSVEAKFTL